MANNRPKKPKIPGYDVLIGPGRVVRGSLHEMQTKSYDGSPRETPVIWFAIAVDKRTPGIDAAIGNIIGYTRHMYQFVAGSQQVQQKLQQPDFVNRTGFAWKVKDGDRDPKWSQREGCQGCWIFQYETQYALRVCDMQ